MPALFNIVRMALRGLLQHPLRSALAGLGILIGVSSIVLMAAISAAVQGSISSRLSDLGARQFLVHPSVVAGAGEAALRLTLADALALDADPAFDGAAPSRHCVCDVSAGRDMRHQRVLGTTPRMFELRRWRIDRGRPFSDEDLRRHDRVAVIGPEIARRLFVDDALGRTLRVQGQVFTVVGVTGGGGLSVDGTDLGALVAVPIEFVAGGAGADRRSVDSLTVQARPEDSADRALARVQDRLADRHRLTRPREDAFQVVNLAAIGEAADSIGQALGAGFLVVALISLLVGGIGIMNVMLAGIAERLHEVGIRLALGATPAAIFLQFLVEAVALCGVAAGVGEALAWAVAAAISATGTLAVQVLPAHAAAGAACAGFVGLVFGLYPAQRAARTSPNLALRVR